MKKLMLLAVCLLALTAQPVRAQTGGANVVVVTIRPLGFNRVRAVIAYDNGKTEVQQFKDGPTDDSQDEATVAYQKLLSKLYQQGYTLKSTALSEASKSTVYIFSKGQ